MRGGGGLQPYAITVRCAPNKRSGALRLDSSPSPSSSAIEPANFTGVTASSPPSSAPSYSPSPSPSNPKSPSLEDGWN